MKDKPLTFVALAIIAFMCCVTIFFIADNQLGRVRAEEDGVLMHYVVSDKYKSSSNFMIGDVSANQDEYYIVLYFGENSTYNYQCSEGKYKLTEIGDSGSCTVYFRKDGTISTIKLE